MSTYENLAESNRAMLRSRFGEEGGVKSAPGQMAERPALARCDRCFAAEMKALSDELARPTGNPTA